MKVLRDARVSCALAVWLAVVGCESVLRGQPAAAVEEKVPSAGEVLQGPTPDAVSLPTVGWRPLTENTILGPWDMIWAQPGGRVEIEITRNGPSRPQSNEETDVRTADGGFTKKKRFRGTAYFIMMPEQFREARVSRVIGPVMVATDRERVRAFFCLYHSPQGGGGWANAEEVEQWRRQLREGEELR
jgi:hypothetical protein